MTDHRKDAETRAREVLAEHAVLHTDDDIVSAHVAAMLAFAASESEAALTEARAARSEIADQPQPYQRGPADSQDNSALAAEYQRGLADAGVERVQAGTLIADIDAEMRGVAEGYADRRGELLFRARHALAAATPPTSEPMVSREAAARVVDRLRLPVEPTIHYSAVHDRRIWNAACEGIVAAIRALPATQDQTDD